MRWRPLRALAHGPGKPQTRDWVAAHESAVKALLAQAPGEESDAIEDVPVLSLLFEELAQARDFEGGLDADDYAVFFDTAARETAVRRQRAHHPRIKSLGLLEARLMNVDVALLAGLDEAVWPPAAKTDSFLSRPMRAELGLSAPERRIGQTAHDFVQAIGAPKVILSRARKRAGSPTTPSRFLQRIRALAGAAYKTSCAAGERYLALAQALDAPGEMKPAARPQPRPPLELRPTRLSVTRIETLRRDPYAIYAERILKLVPLDGLDEDESAQGFGTRMHEVLARFQKDNPNGPGANAREALLAIARGGLRGPAQRSAIRRVPVAAHRGDLRGMARLGGAAARRIVHAFTWRRTARSTSRSTDGSTFTLSAKADRIEKRADGAYVVIDYKTGAPPSPVDCRRGLCAAADARSGDDCARRLSGHSRRREGRGRDVRQARRRRRARGKGHHDSSRPRSAAELGAEHFDGLKTLLLQFRNPETPYLPRPFPQFESKGTTYDHLSRYREWSSGGGAE